MQLFDWLLPNDNGEAIAGKLGLSDRQTEALSPKPPPDLDKFQPTEYLLRRLS